MSADRPDDAESDEVYAAEDADRLTDLLLDVVGPALAWWRVEAARRLDVDSPSLVCLELVRRHRRVPSSLIAERAGLTRSGVSKMLRRLRDAGHVDLLGGGERGKSLEVELRPHEERDAELAEVRRELRDRVRWSVIGLFSERERATAVRLLREAASCVHLVAEASVDGAAEARRVAETARRREREARDLSRW